ncbi:MAG TPA: TonB-dependent receptor [Terriglobales bacterium]|nr:TonB-dependent receptor [Terriglobales bacterium]
MQRLDPVLRHTVHTDSRHTAVFCRRTLKLFLFVIIFDLLFASHALASSLSGSVTDPQGKRVAAATVRLIRTHDSSALKVDTDDEGQFSFPMLQAGEYQISADSAGFVQITRNLVLGDGDETTSLQFSAIAPQSESVTVSADIGDLGVLSPDPAERLMLREEMADANPGRPGLPVSIPGMPVESPAGGIKPPQYFLPGVAGDHGEPIAMFFQVGGFLFPNNLPANAHGNGYADPNAILPVAIESVQTDAGAFNVREGNHSVNSSMILGLRDKLEPMVRLTSDYRDLDMTTSWSPANAANRAWVGFNVSFGNGFLARAEHRKQYRVNASKVFNFGKHELTVYGIGYYGFAYQPGLIPIDKLVADDTIDARQREETSNGAVIFNDVWRLRNQAELQFSGFYRHYTLDVRPNFGAGLIRQSESRNANSEDLLYTQKFSEHLSLLAGANFRREAPRDLRLDHITADNLLQPVTNNNVTSNFYSPYVAVDWQVLPLVHYNIGFRRDEVQFENQDLYSPGLSFSRQAGINSPKATISLLPPQATAFFPTVSLSYGQSFHTNDPRIGTSGIQHGTVVSKARSYQLVASKTVAKTEFRITLEHVTTAQQLARISNDTGLQDDEGPGILKSVSITARRHFRRGFLQGLFARADARDRLTGEPTPEAPRVIWDVLGTIDKLPLHLVARGEYEQVGRKPLGNGFVSVPVREFRSGVTRPFEKLGIEAGLNFLLSSGYGGQTLETLALPGEAVPFERVTGLPLKSYVTASINFQLRRH